MKKVLLLMAIGLIPNPIKKEENINHNIRQAATVSNESLRYIGRVSTNGSNLNVRSSASTSSSIITKLANNTYVEIFSETGSFYKVKYNQSNYGYVSKSYCKVASSTIKTVTASSLNIRSGASTYYTKIGSLEKGSNVGVISTSNGWSRIVYNGTKLGYVSSQYLTSKSTATYKYPSVNIGLTEFKQFDSRWAYKYLGNSKETFKRAGCVTTSLAMLESKRTGRVIDPYEYSKTQKYTSTGAIYWPSQYNVITSSTSYLEKIYNIIKTGKPVTIGLKNSNGGQHFVVIKGYKGSDTLSTKNFIVSDPGSSTRTLLSEVMASYSRFYKYVYAK